MFFKSLKWISCALVLTAVVVCIASIVINRNHDTLERRQEVFTTLQTLVEKVQRDPTDRESLDNIITILNGDWSFARTHACIAIGRLGPLGRPAVPDLIRALDCGDLFVEREAAKALGEVAVGMKEPVAALTSKMHTARNRDSGAFSAEALGKIGEPALSAIPDLVELAASPKTSSTDTMPHAARGALEELRAIQQRNEQ